MTSQELDSGKSSARYLQLLKLAVYTLLLINFAQYIRNDWVIAAHTMRHGGGFLEWTQAFAVTIDEGAWFVLLFLLELETYVLSDEALTRWRTLAIRGIRLVCFVSIAHTIFAYSDIVYDVSRAPQIEGVTDLCQLADTDVSYAKNLVYTEIGAQNCASLSTADRFFYVDPPDFLIVEDSEGLTIERELAWVDLIEAIVWLFILLFIEIGVRVQDRGIARGPIIKLLSKANIFLFSLLGFAALYWIYRGHWMFAWDELVWVAGFAAIEMNMAQWRDEIIESEDEVGVPG